MPAPAPAAENGAGVPKTELQELQFKAQQVTDDVNNNNHVYQIIKSNLIASIKLLKIYSFTILVVGKYTTDVGSLRRGEFYIIPF